MIFTPKNHDLKDYKFYCFNGVPQYCQVISDRNENETIDFFDMNWCHQNFTGLALPKKKFSKFPIYIPKPFEDMKKIVKKLAKGIPFVRVDLYCIDNKIYFGEMTFFPACGMGCFSPDEWNKKMGSYIELPH